MFVFASPPSMFDAVFPAPFGAIGVRLEGERVKELTYLPEGSVLRPSRKALAKEVGRQLAAYFKNPDAPFDLPLMDTGSAFQQRVWHAIAAIPRGEVRSYGTIARVVRSAPRAVGQACGANWYALVIPCHRVVAARGIGGFGHLAPGAADAFPMRVKRWLLAHEGAKDARLER